GFSAEYESRTPFALIAGVYIDTAFAGDAVPLADTPPALMIAGNGKSSLERHGAIAVDTSKMARLTPLGRMVRDRYRPTVEAVESLLDPDATLRTALESLPVHDRGHADHPDVRHVGRNAGFAEVSART